MESLNKNTGLESEGLGIITSVLQFEFFLGASGFFISEMGLMTNDVPAWEVIEKLDMLESISDFPGF